MLGQATDRALMHLRSVNSHVSSLLSSKTQVLTSSDGPRQTLHSCPLICITKAQRLITAACNIGS